MKTPIVLLMMAIMSVTWLSAETPAQKYCGRRLAAVIAALCNGNPSKRIPEYDYGWPWLLPYQVHQIRGKRDGIIAECCDKACTTEELMTYC